MEGNNFFHEFCFGLRDVFDSLAGHWIGQEADKITRVTGLHCHADFAVRLETANPWPVARARIDHDKRPAPDVDLCSDRRSDAHQRIVHRWVQLSSVIDQFNFIVEDMGCGFQQMFAVLQPAPAHNIQKQHAALSGIDQIFEGGGKKRR